MRKTKVKIRHVHVMIISLLIISLFIYGIIGKTKQKDIKEDYGTVEENSIVLDRMDKLIFNSSNISDNDVNIEIKDNNTEQMENAQELQLINDEIQLEPHIDENGVKYVTYEDFGAKVDEEYDCYKAMKETHEYANYHNYEVRATLPSYNIYKLDDINPIIIKTNTDWNNATIVIHDENINNLQTKDYPIFRIESTEENISITDIQILEKITVNKNTKKIPELAGYGNKMCIVYNEEEKQYIRSGYNKDEGQGKTDIFNIDDEGNVLNEIQWDFNKITQIILVPIPKEELTLQNATIITRLPYDNYEQESGYFNRSITCNRSNTVIKNVKHQVDDIEKIGGPYYGFIRLSYVTNIKLKSMILYTHKFDKASNYDLILKCCTNVLIEDVTSNDIEDKNRWGITGTNYTKDITYKNCELNRIDAHCGVYNLTIDNCIVGFSGLTLNGAGKLKILNTTRKGGSKFIDLRSDYGSTWNGDIEIYNCTFESNKTSRLIGFSVSYDEDGKLHDYGYDRVLPNVYIDGLTINNTSNDYVLEYIFFNDKSSTGNELGDLIKAGYTLPSKIEVKNYSIDNGKRLKAFYQDFDDSKNVSTNIAIPDKPVLNFLDGEGEKYESGNITNKNITLNVLSVNNVTSEIFVNKQRVSNNFVLTETGDYSIELESIDNAENIEQDNYEVIIDKIAPTIEGVEKGSVYYESVTPIVKDNDIKSSKLYLSGNLVTGYKLNSTIEQVGRYDLEIIDNAGNVTRTNFEIKEPTITDLKKYTIKEDKFISGIEQGIELKVFSQNSETNQKYTVYRDNKELKETEIVKTGDILKIGKKEYSLIVNGDLNKDGIVNIMDLMKVKRNVISNLELNETESLAADVNNDGEINIIDVMQIVRMIINN